MRRDQPSERRSLHWKSPESLSTWLNMRLQSK